MKQLDFEAEIRRRVGEEPFLPFVIELSTGERLRIDRANELVHQEGKAAHVPAQGELTLFDYHAVREIHGD